MRLDLQWQYGLFQDGSAVSARDKTAVQLARELLADLESCDHRSSRPVLLKAARLARLRQLIKVERWIDFELRGYVETDSLAREFMEHTRRWIDKKNNVGWWDALPVIEQRIGALKIQLHASSRRDNQPPASANGNSESDRLIELIARLSRIECIVYSLVHEFAEDTLRKCADVETNHQIVNDQRHIVNSWLADDERNWNELSARFEQVYMGDIDATQVIVAGCSELLEAAANKLYPADGEPTRINGTPVELEASRFGPRLYAYILSRPSAAGRHRRLKHTLFDLMDRLTLVSHGDITPNEATFLYMTTYLFLSELHYLDRDGETNRALSGVHRVTASS